MPYAVAELPETDTGGYCPRGAVRQLWGSRAHEQIIAGPAECVAGETSIFDPVAGTLTPISELCERRIAPAVQTLWGPAQAETPFCKGSAPLFRLITEDGRSFVCTRGHKLLTPNGWRFVGTLRVGDLVLASSQNLLASSSEPFREEFWQDDRCLNQTVQDYPARCFAYRRPCGEPPLRAGDSARSPVPPRIDVHGHSRDGWRLDDLEASTEHNRRSLQFARPSIGYCAEVCFRTEHTEYDSSKARLSQSASSCLPGAQFPKETGPLGQVALLDPAGDHTHLDSDWFGESHSASGKHRPAEASIRVDLPSSALSDSGCINQGSADTDQALNAYIPSPDTSCLHYIKVSYPAHWSTVSSIEYERFGEFYDLHVPGAEHYLAEGIWHHNTGKTYGCLQYAHSLLWKYPGAQGVMVRKTYSSLVSSALLTYRRILGPDSPVKPFGGEKPEWFDYPNSSRLWIVGMDNPQKVLSSERDFFYVNQAEELQLEDWETLTTRCTGRGAVMPYTRIFGDCNPGAPSHWIKHRECLDLLSSRHEDNPTLFDDAGNITPQGERTLAVLDRLTGTRYLRLRKGLWAQAEGVVYEGWDPAIHIIDPFPIPENWRRYWVVDFGYTNPFVWLNVAEDPDGRLYVYREIYRTQRLVEDHAQAIRIATAGERPPLAVICDHDAEDRATLERHLGMGTVQAIKDVRPGIQEVSARLRIQGDGKPRLFFFANALVEPDLSLQEARKPICTVQEFDGYVWERRKPLSRNGQLVNEREEPLKKDDHGLDAVRYLCQYLTIDPGVITGRNIWG